MSVARNRPLALYVNLNEVEKELFDRLQKQLDTSNELGGHKASQREVLVKALQALEEKLA